MILKTQKPPNKKNRIQTQIKTCSFFCFFLVLFSSCDHVSKLLIKDISQICSNLTVYQFDDKQAQITVYLTDKDGNIIENDSIRVFLNGLETTQEEAGGFYGRPARYYLMTALSNNYTFELVLPNKKKYFLAKVDALKDENKAVISCEEKGDFNKDLVLKWSGLKEITELEIERAFKLFTPGNSFEAQKPIAIKIKPTGTYVYPKAEFKTSSAKINLLTFNFMRRKQGITNPNLLEGSSVTIEELPISKTVEFP